MPSKQSHHQQRQALIESVSHEGRGVARVENKAVFIDGGLPGETVSFHYIRRRRHYDEGALDEVREPSPLRIDPRCSHFPMCGGCRLQYLNDSGQIDTKQSLLLEALARIGGVTPEHVLPPVTGNPWGYRRKARIGVRYVVKQGRLLVGFRERQGKYLADLSRCEVLHPAIGLRLQALRGLIAGLSAYRHIPQVEVAVGDTRPALVFRHLQPLDEYDREKLRRFGRWYSICIYLQPGGPGTVAQLWPGDAQLSYRLPDQDIDIVFSPTDFIQVNGPVNRKLVRLVLELLDPRPDERALELFCGLGNFTLPMARKFAYVTGVEGDGDLVQRARDNAARNAVVNADFYVWNLEREMRDQPWWRDDVNKVLLDPPRTGAEAAVAALAGINPARIVYVSCNPSTLARDARVLVRDHGYRLHRVAAVDMFPHTAHIEAVALFDRTE